MRIRQTIKKAVALGTGALMLGATILGASAYNVSDYPSAFVKDGKVTAKIVVGEKAQAIDVVGAIDIAADLQAAAVSKETVTTTGGVSVSGGKTEDLGLNVDLNGEFSSLDDSDLSGLQNTQLTIDIDSSSEDYDVSEVIDTTTGLIIETGLTAANTDEDFQDKIFLTVDKDSITYRYVFDDALDNGKYLQNATTDDPIELQFLGKTLSIVGADADSVTVEVGTKQFLNVGDTVTVGTSKVKLVKVSDTAAVVDVDGSIVTIDDGSTKTSNGVRVKVEDVFNDDGTADDSATLTVGEDVTKTYDDGDEYIGQDEDDPDWVWQIDLSTPSAPSLGVNFDQVLDDSDEVVYMGEKITLPNDFAEIYIDSLNQAGEQEYKVTTSIEELKNAAGTATMVSSGHVIHFESLAGTDDGFEISATSIEKTDDVYAYYNSTSDQIQMYWKDKDDNKIKLADTAVSGLGVANVFNITYKDTVLTVDTDGYFTNTTGNVSFVIDGANQDIRYYFETTSNNYDYVGDSDGDTTTANDVVAGGVDISGWEENTRTQDGIVLYSYEDTDSSDEYKFSVPKETSDYKVNVIVKTKGSSVSAEAGSVTTDKVNAIGVDFGVLDKDAPAAGASNLIVVGGPCVNTVAARLSGNPANCVEGFAEGEAKLAMFDDSGKVALLVAGYSGLDTSGATRALITEILPAKSSAKVITTNYKKPTVQ